jgi:hypothetical protein
MFIADRIGAVLVPEIPPPPNKALICRLQPASWTSSYSSSLS